MNLIIVTINDGNDWNNHKVLVNSINDYEFITIFNQGIYDISIDVTYYLYIKEKIIIPIKEDEDIKIKFILNRSKAILNVYINNEVIAAFNIEVYDKNSINPEWLIKLYK